MVAVAAGCLLEAEKVWMVEDVGVGTRTWRRGVEEWLEKYAWKYVEQAMQLDEELSCCGSKFRWSR